jgi:hypothetical protein
MNPGGRGKALRLRSIAGAVLIHGQSRVDRAELCVLRFLLSEFTDEKLNAERLKFL